MSYEIVKMLTKIAFAFLSFLACILASDAYIVDYGPVVKATKGKLELSKNITRKSQVESH